MGGDRQTGCLSLAAGGGRCEDDEMIKKAKELGLIT